MRAALAPALAALAVVLSACGGSGSSGGGGGADAARDAQLVAELPAPFNTGDAARGRSLFAVCTSCHTIAEGGADMVGPNLHGVFGRKAASKPGFAYSDALKATGWTWDAAHVDTWITDPNVDLPGTKMTFAGLKDPKDRTDVIAYLMIQTGYKP